MKKTRLVLFNLIALLFLEGLYSIITFDSYLRSTILAIVSFVLVGTIFNTIILKLFNYRVNFIVGCVIYSVLGLIFGTQIVFKQVFNTYFQISLFALSDQAMAFGKETFLIILSNLPLILLFFLPIILFIVLRKKIGLEKSKLKENLIFLVCFLLILTGHLIYSNTDKITNKLIYQVNDNSQSIEHLGVAHSFVLDLAKTIMGFEEKIVVVDLPKEETIFEYDYNNLNIDFSKGNNETINNYMINSTGTNKNKYTGIFEGKNLIYIVAESFHSIGVDEQLTPTLYKLINSGFKFDNFYVPNNLSTIGGEFQAITGLYPDNSILGTWRSGNNYYPYGLANMFKNLGYSTYAYHNNSYVFQDRNKYLASQGFNNFKACYNGLEKLINCNIWPQSDVEMIDKTTKDYLNNNEPFLAYYVTVSGHFSYTFNDNYIAYKNRKYVNNLDYSEKVRGYIATQIELDKALELLIKRLEEKGILDDTVIVLLADHYPYDLSINEVNERSTYKRDDVVEVNHNNLIIWNNKLKPLTIDKVSMSMDVLPTVYNLFGVEYDSRLLMGSDIFSDNEGIAIMKNRSWVTNKGTYYSKSNKFVANEEVSEDYVDTINQIVSNKLNISKMIVSNNYYKSLFK